MKNLRKSKQEIIRRLVGAWTLIAWVEIQSNAKQVYPLGKSAVGQILYSADGHVATQWRAAGEGGSVRMTGGTLR